MAKHRKPTDDNELKPELVEVPVEKVVEKVVFAPVKSVRYNNLRVRSMVSAFVRYHGAVTGNEYEWPRAGAEALVDERDVPNLLSKRIGNRSCCGDSDANRIFELVAD